MKLFVYTLVTAVVSPALAVDWIVDDDGKADFADIQSAIIANWGNPYSVSDLLATIANWGDCD